MKPISAPLQNLVLLRNVVYGGFLNSAGIGFTVYIFAILYPGICATSGMLNELRSGVITMANVGEGSLFIAVPSLLLGMLIFARHGVFKAIYRAQPFLVFLFIFSSMVLFVSLVGADFLISGSQMIQYAITIGVFLLSLCFWQAPTRYIDDALTMAVIALFISLISAALIQGFHEYRWVGLIHPNHYARYAYVALVLHAMLTRRTNLFVFVLCFAAAYMVSARTVMIGMLLFYLGMVCCLNYNAITSRVRQIAGARIAAAFLIAIPLGGLFASFFFDSDRVIDKLIRDLAIFDPDRGVSSGFTGRTDSWSTFFNSMDQFVFFGYGFRSSRYGLHAVHSGVLSYFMDFGLILGGILLTAVIARSVYLVWFGLKDDKRALAAGMAACTTLVIQCFEPDNFNIGFIGAFFFMLILSYIGPTKDLPPQRLRRARPQMSRRIGGESTPLQPGT